jgi:hypothetical protein
VPSQRARELHDRTTPPQGFLRGVIIHNLKLPQAMAVRVNSITLELLDLNISAKNPGLTPRQILPDGISKDWWS